MRSKSAEPWILAVDLGTGGPKTGAVSLDGRLLARHSAPVATHHLPGGGAEQHPDEWWARIVEGVNTLHGYGVDPEGLAGVGLTGMWACTVPVDSEGRAAGPCIIWSDTRGGRFAAKVMGGPVSLFGFSPGNIVQWLRFTGGAPSPHGADPLGHELYLRHCEPAVYERTAALMEPLDYLAMRLTDRRAATPASMIASWLTDNRPRSREPRYVPALLRRSTRDPRRLPELIPTGSTVGRLADAAAAELRLKPGAPVVTGVPDLHTAVLGSGFVRPYEAHITISSTSWIGCDVPFKKTDVMHQIASVPGLEQGRYVVANNHETAGLCLRWMRDALAAAGPPPTYDELCALAASAPAGSGGVIFTPWLSGERSPVEDRNLRAAFLNVSIDTDAPCLVRSVLEGVAFNARWLLDAVEKFLGRRLDVLRILGGGAESDLWCQIHADVLGRRIEKVAEPTHANLRGAGLYAAVALGHVAYKDVRRLVPVARTFEPDPAAREVYEPVYAEYRRLYGRLHPLYGRLNRSA